MTAPNADTLYAKALFDVGKKPYELSLPAMEDLYVLLPLLNEWTTFFEVPGKPPTGCEAQTYVITGPDWEGKIPVALLSGSDSAPRKIRRSR